MPAHRFFEPCSIHDTVGIITRISNQIKVHGPRALCSCPPRMQKHFPTWKTHLCNAFKLVTENTLDCHSLSSSDVITGAWQPPLLSLLSGDSYRGTASATKFAGAVSPLSRNLGALGFLASIYLCNPARCPQGWGSPFLFRNITAIWSSLTGLTRHFPGSRSSFLRFHSPLLCSIWKVCTIHGCHRIATILIWRKCVARIQAY